MDIKELETRLYVLMGQFEEAKRIYQFELNKLNEAKKSETVGSTGNSEVSFEKEPVTK